MREILFRGKRVDNGEWIEGSLVNNIFCRVDTYAAVPYIINPDEYEEYCCMEDIGELAVEVIPETVGQFTGLLDKSSDKIFEGDIIEYPPQRKKFIVEFYNDCFGARDKKDKRTRIGSGDDFIIIGNIHDNPEILT